METFYLWMSRTEISGAIMEALHLVPLFPWGNVVYLKSKKIIFRNEKKLCISSCCSTIPPISTKWTLTSHLKPLDTKKGENILVHVFSLYIYQVAVVRNTDIYFCQIKFFMDYTITLKSWFVWNLKCCFVIK